MWWNLRYIAVHSWLVGPKTSLLVGFFPPIRGVVTPCAHLFTAICRGPQVTPFICWLSGAGFPGPTLQMISQFTDVFCCDLEAPWLSRLKMVVLGYIYRQFIATKPPRSPQKGSLVIKNLLALYRGLDYPFTKGVQQSTVRITLNQTGIIKCQRRFSL